MKNSITIIVIIPTYNRKDKLSKILLQLFEQNLQDNIKLIIVVVIDGSTDGTLDMVHNDYKRVHVLLGDGNWWYTKSMNEGFKFAQRFSPDFVLTLNDDIEIPENYISTIVNDYFSLGEVDCIIGSTSITNDNKNLIIFAGIKDYKYCGIKRIHYYSPLEVSATKLILGIHKSKELTGRGMLIPNNILKKSNYFDETFPQYGSDTDFCFRVAKSGVKILISWNAVIKVNIILTRIRCIADNDTIILYIKDLFDKYSHNSIRKFALFHLRHYSKFGIIWKIPYSLIGSIVYYSKKYLNSKNNYF